MERNVRSVRQKVLSFVIPVGSMCVGVLVGIVFMRSESIFYPFIYTTGGILIGIISLYLYIFLCDADIFQRVSVYIRTILDIGYTLGITIIVMIVIPILLSLVITSQLWIGCGVVLVSYILSQLYKILEDA